MTAPLGSRTCPVLGCHRAIHVTDSGIVYARCLAHALALLGAFGSPQDTSPVASPFGGRRVLRSVKALPALISAGPQ